MRIRAHWLTALLAVAALAAGAAPASAKSAPKPKEIVGKITGVDLQQKSIQVEVGAGKFETYFVIGRAADRLDSVPLGSIFKLTLQQRADPAGEVVIEIKKARAPSKPSREPGVVDQSTATDPGYCDGATAIRHA